MQSELLLNFSLSNGSLNAPVIGGAALLALTFVALIVVAIRRRRARKSGEAGLSSNNSADTAKNADVQPTPKPEYVALAFLLQPEPLGNIPGTGLPADLIALAGRSISYHVAALGEVSMESDESASLLHVALWRAIESKFAAELCTHSNAEPASDAEPASELQHLVLNAIELSSSTEGYAARISYQNKKYTVLIGSAAPVALASAPFSAELSEFAESNRHNDSTLVLVIDGIAYAAISLNEIGLKQS